MGCGSSTQNDSRVGSFSDPETDLPFLGSDAPSVPISADAVKPFTFGKKVDLDEVLRMRADFWSSRVEGNAMIWQTLKSAAENILDGDIPLANAILEASSVSTPHGSLYRCYDELGTMYSIPRYCYCNPKEMMEASSSKSKDKGHASDSKEQEGGSGGGGGGIPLQVRVRVAPGEVDGTIESSSGTTVRQFKEQVAAYFRDTMKEDEKKEEEEKDDDENATASSSNNNKNNNNNNNSHLSEEQRAKFAQLTKERLRVVYLGQELEEKKQLSHYAINEEMIVHIYLRPDN